MTTIKLIESSNGILSKYILPYFGAFINNNNNFLSNYFVNFIIEYSNLIMYTIIIISLMIITLIAVDYLFNYFYHVEYDYIISCKYYLHLLYLFSFIKSVYRVAEDPHQWVPATSPFNSVNN